MPDRDAAVVRCRRLRRRIVVAGAFALQRQVDHGPDDGEVGDVGAARPQARQRQLGLDAAGREAVVGLALPRVLQHDVAQRQGGARPEADLGVAIDGELIAGLALDPLGDGRCEEGGRDPDRGHQDDDRDHGSDGGPGEFQCSHVVVPGRAGSVRSVRPRKSPADRTRLSRKRDLAPMIGKIIRYQHELM